LKGVPLEFYADTPFDAPPEPPPAGEDEAVVIVNFFGCRTGRDYAAFYERPAAVIEDHTHDPWSDWAASSRAQFVFASLRKTLPVPDGGAVWSPADASLPAPPAGVAQAASVMASGMALKRDYLAGADIAKDTFLSAFREAESRFRAELEPGVSESTRELIGGFPVRRWRDRRRRNHALLAKAVTGYEMLPAAAEGACPFSFVILLPDRDSRERLRAYLVGRSIYPAVLWPFEEPDRRWAGERVMDISGRILSIHCDGRYGIEDMQKVAATLQRFQDHDGSLRRRFVRENHEHG
jgi:hypothetical protein